MGLDDGACELEALEVQHQHLWQAKEVHMACGWTCHIAALRLVVCSQVAEPWRWGEGEEALKKSKVLWGEKSKREKSPNL